MGQSMSLFTQEDPPSVELVPDVLTTIFALLELPDLVRAASVSTFWSSVYTQLHSQLGQTCDTPCFLYISESDEDNFACLYSFAEKRIYKLILPDPPIHTRHIIGSSHGWLVTADNMSELHLLNPITCEQIALPSILTLDQVTPVMDNEGVLRDYDLWYPQYEYTDLEMIGHAPTTYAFDKLRDYLYYKAFVFPDPFTGSYIVVLIHEPDQKISFARAGDCAWTFLPLGSNYHDCLYKDGLLYATTAIGGIVAYDLTGPTVTTYTILDDMDNSIYEQIYIVQSPWGDLLQIWRDQPIIPDNDDPDVIMETGKIFVHKVDMAKKELVEMNGLNDHVLFLGRNKSQCLSVKKYPQLKANCAYFTGDAELRFEDNQRDIGVLNLGNNSIENDIVPQLYSIRPNPIWITPNPRMMCSGLM